ncbi:hypothetical protein DB346_19935 [Verrucomicrobia bacterium LW23]|nr:hypothetical protein DB346_19935 [Verrucomicrobia bacterium LW23]
MNIPILERHFARMGARFKVTRPVLRRWARPGDGSFAMNIGRDTRGEFFDLSVSEEAEARYDAAVLNVSEQERHLLFLVRDTDEAAAGTAAQKQRFLCGHDERAWFVAAVPDATATTVRAARESLKPLPVYARQLRMGLRASEANRRRNEAFVRQGEWFFIPEPRVTVESTWIRRNEPLRRGNGSKPHVVAELYRHGGEVVYVSDKFPGGVSPERYLKLITARPGTASTFRQMRRNARVYARGTVRHADHKTIVLHCWHQVMMNTENEAPAMRNVAFLD